MQNLNTDGRWWVKSAGEEPHDRLIRVVQRIDSNQSYRKEEDLRHAKLYSNSPILGLTPRTFTPSSRRGGTDRLSLNVVKNMVGAVVAKISKNKPKATFLTQGGDQELQLKAKRLEKFVEGQFYESDLYDLAPKIFRDGCIFGTGCLKIFASEGKIVCERVFPWELRIDDQESMYGEPCSLYQRRYVDRLRMQELFPEHADELERTRQDREDIQFGYDSTADQVLVTEGWHRPSGKNATDGRHVIAVENCTLLDEEWNKGFPFIFIRWNEDTAGFWGVGLAQELMGIQLEINKLLREIQRAHHLLGKAHWMVDAASKVISAHLDNDTGTIIRYSGGLRPEVYTPQVVPSEVYQHLWALYQKAYEVTGISQLSAQSQIPAGLQQASGKALQTYDDIETERFIVVGRTYEKLFLDAAKLMISLAKELAEEGEYKVKAPSQKFIQMIDWKDVNLEEDEYVMRIFPTSALADEPAMRMAQVQNLANAGWIAPEDAKRLLDFPDLEGVSNLETASYDLIMDIIEQIRDHGRYISPEPFMDLPKSIAMMQMAYLRAKIDNVPEQRLAMMRQFMVDAKDLLNQPDSTQPPAPPQPIAPTITPGPIPGGAPPSPSPPPPGMPMAA